MMVTPGDWKLVEHQIGNAHMLYIIVGNFATLAQVFVECGAEIDEARDNARLMAASKKLLAACEAAAQHAGRYEDNVASQLARLYDALPGQFNLTEAGFFDWLEQAKEIRQLLYDAIAQAKGDE